MNLYLTKLNYSRKIHINGIKISIPSIRGMTCEASEPWNIYLLSKVLHEFRGAFIDVGVNLGQTLVKVKALDKNREYIGFEPNPACVYYLQCLIKENIFENCTLFPVGLFTKDCVLYLDLFSDNLNGSGASLIKNFRPDHKIYSRIFVPVFQFDSLALLMSSKCVGIVKIDVEGAELEVVKSLLNLIRRDKPIILIEVLPVYSDENVFRINRQGELEQIFADNGYSILRVEKTSANTYSGLRHIEKIGIHSNLNQCDYVIVPNDKFAKFIALIK
ncbi:FkbM family methyltransferase [Candidatus Latescibacterota bacterium]